MAGPKGDGRTSAPAPESEWSARRLGLIVLMAAVILVLVRMFVVQVFVIPSTSMQPLLGVGDRVLVSRWEYRVGEIQRGDVVVFDGAGVFEPPAPEPNTALGRGGRSVAEALGVPVGESDYVKRVVGLPGDHVVCCDATGHLTVNGVPLAEPYLAGDGPASMTGFDIVVPEGRLWVMGDNRDDSADSRAHRGSPGGGTVPVDQVVGRVTTIWWPWDRITGVGRTDASTASQG